MSSAMIKLVGCFGLLACSGQQLGTNQPDHDEADPDPPPATSQQPMSAAQQPMSAADTEAEQAADPGGLSVAAVQKTVRANFAAFRECYERGLKGNPHLQGSVVVFLLVAPDGTVRMAKSKSESDGIKMYVEGRVLPASVAATTMPDPVVVDCIVEEYKKLSFPRSGDTTPVVYPLKFET